MRLRGSIVQRLIHLFEGIHLCESKVSDRAAANQENHEVPIETEMEPTSFPSEASSEHSPSEITPPEAQNEKTPMSLPLLHSSVFFIPSLQMLFELVGYRPRRQTVLDMAELCQRLFKLVHVLRQPIIFNEPMERRDRSHEEELARLNHQRDILDNVERMRPRCNCSLPTTSEDANGDERKKCSRHRPTWPAPRSRARVRRRSADEPAVRTSFPEEDAPKVYGPPTLAEVLLMEQSQTIVEAATSEPKTEPAVTEEVVVAIGKPTSIEANIETTTAQLEDFNKSVETLVQEVQRSLSPAPSPLTTKEEEEDRQYPMPKVRNNRLKRKLLPKPSSPAKESDEYKVASALARKRFLQQRLSKKEIRRVRHLFRHSLNPSIFSQFCATKGEARCTEQIEWKSDRCRQKRPISPDIDMWATLATRDSMLENSFYYTDSDTLSPPPTTSKNLKESEKVHLKNLISKGLTNIGPAEPCCRCFCNCNRVDFRKVDAATGTEAKMVNASTQTTTSFVCNDEPATWPRRKENRSKSEGGGEKQSTRHNVTKRFLDFINEQTSCVTGTRQQRASHKQEALEFRQFLLSRFLETSANQDADLEQDTDTSDLKSHEEKSI